MNSEEIISRNYETVENLRCLENTLTTDMVTEAKKGNTVELLKLSIIYKNVFGRR